MNLRCPRVRGISKATWQKGIAVELEHTSSRRIARCIAAVHFEESKRYYDHLERMERQMKRGK